MFRILRKPNGIALREAAAHQRAASLVKVAVGISFSYATLVWKTIAPPSLPLASLAMAVFWITVAFYLGTVAALTEVRSLRTIARNHRRAMGASGMELQGFMADLDLIGLLLGGVLPFIIIMCASAIVHPHH